jgi:tRNA pseudouridine65 synthase
MTQDIKTLPVLYQDKQLIAVNKPSGLLVHRSNIDRHESQNAMKIVRDQLGQWVYPVHRIDKSTSGVLVFALDPETARLMTDLFSNGKILKNYIAVVRGFTKELERIDYPLRELRDRMTDQKADRDKPAQRALTDYRRLATVEIPRPVGPYASARFSLVQVTPLTGRNHQIRRHMKHIFHPVINDTTYGDGKQNIFFRSNLNCRRMLLHAKNVGFVHPLSGEQLSFEASFDAAFAELLDKLAWSKYIF